MKRTLSIAVLCAALTSPAWAACDAPSPPGAIPNGKSASKEEMLAKKKEVDQYKRDVEAFLSCEANPRRTEPVAAELERVANKFNAEIRAFKAANAEA